MNQQEIYRIIDVNANRAREGLRVVEEATRFVLNDSQFTVCLKELRHRVTGILKSFPAKNLLSARDSRGDVGRKLYQAGEARRDDYREIIRANMVRSQEALRALEEFSKLIDSQIGEKFKSLRFQLYSLEKKISGSPVVEKDKGQLVRNWKLYVVLDRRLVDDRDPVEIVKALVAGGVTVIQWRDKKENLREAIEIVSRLRGCNDLEDINVIINDRVDMVLALGADGIHLGQDDLPLREARKLLGEKIIGVSTHSEEEALRAEEEGADYISLGPIFPTQTKEDAVSSLGVRKIEEVKKAIGIPLVAIGGINADNIGEVISAGADTVAVASAVLKAKDITAAAGELLSKFQ